jgi:hypothetical protein
MTIPVSFLMADLAIIADLERHVNWEIQAEEART